MESPLFSSMSRVSSRFVDHVGAANGAPLSGPRLFSIISGRIGKIGNSQISKLNRNHQF